MNSAFFKKKILEKSSNKNKKKAVIRNKHGFLSETLDYCTRQQSKT